MRIVRREQANLLARLLNHPTDILSRIRGDSHLAAQIFGRAQGEFSQPFFMTAKGFQRRIQLSIQSGYPGAACINDSEFQIRESFQDAVYDQRTERLRWGPWYRHIIYRGEIFITAMEILHWR